MLVSPFSWRVGWSGSVRLKGNGNWNNYRGEYWIMLAASRTMSAHFAPRRAEEHRTCRRKECHQ
ncbi:hypothetical protein ES815_02510 [Leclercia adecarboxylata]|uniref:Uncharacterized protein n=1 Tax=Leclercia adecarboxylata TaxID=83655 RepID=A0AAP9D9N7_9ENTR|nr:hypothetical protein ES815_02510 [Leclercia adecarboxylata]